MGCGLDKRSLLDERSERELWVLVGEGKVKLNSRGVVCDVHRTGDEFDQCYILISSDRGATI